MKILKEIKMYKTNLELITVEEGESCSLNLDGTYGEFTEEDWYNDDIVSSFNKEGRDKIISTLHTMEVIK